MPGVDIAHAGTRELCGVRYPRTVCCCTLTVQTKRMTLAGALDRGVLSWRAVDRGGTDTAYAAIIGLRAGYTLTRY
eukprot:1165054-Rhodomonas_salina.2